MNSKKYKFETFKKIGPYERKQLKQENTKASTFEVNVIKFRVTIEIIEEAESVIFERLVKLHHNTDDWYIREKIDQYCRKNHNKSIFDIIEIWKQ